MVAFIDYELGRLLTALEQRRLLERTIIVFTSDHGDFAAEHHLLYKTGSLVDAMVRIPLILSWPGRLPENRQGTGIGQSDRYHADVAPALRA